MSTAAACHIATEWAEAAPGLAEWVDANLVNRRDVYGSYTKGGKSFCQHEPPTLEVITQHFRGRNQRHIIGLYTTVRDENGCWSRWLAIDIDCHDDKADPGANLGFALSTADAAEKLGFDPLLFDSNGRGGYHIWLLFEGPVATDRVHAFGKWLIKEWKAFGLSGAPETFPKQPSITPSGKGSFGNFVRLPGRHHKRPHYTRVWNGAKWLEGSEAAAFILETKGASASAIPAEAPSKPKPARPRRSRAMANLTDDAKLAEEALGFLGDMVNNYDDWLKIGMCLTKLGRVGLDLWEDWSRDGNEYEEGACADKWETFDAPGANGVSLGTLFHLAKQGGWKGQFMTIYHEGKPMSFSSSRNGNGVAHIELKEPTEEPEEEPTEEPPPEADDSDSEEIVDPWPQLNPVAYQGVVGEMVWMTDPHTEADPVATLVQFLVAFGNMIGRGPHFVVGATRHYLNLFAVLVGITGMGRKGTSWDVAKWILGSFDHEWSDNRIQGGLVSGEGLIYHVRDATQERRKGKPTKTGDAAPEDFILDPGVSDKRLMIVETEISRMLKAMNRESNTLSDVLRQAWESGALRTLGKQNPVKATGAHISLLAHATKPDVARHLTDADSANGFANRFLWAAVRNSKDLPDGGDLFSVNWTNIQRRVARVIPFARGVDKMVRDAQATKLWREVYGDLVNGKSGRLADVLSRAQPIVMRLACLYALLDTSAIVQTQHLVAALALWKYCEDSAAFIFGDFRDDTKAAKLIEALKLAPTGLLRSEIVSAVFGGHCSKATINRMLADLLTRGLIHATTDESTGGRKGQRWHSGRRPA